MIDLHFDLLTKLYTSYLESDFTFIENFVKAYNRDNVCGLIANMSFMSEDEMKLEYHPKYYHKEVTLLEMVYVAKKLLKKYIPRDIKVIMSIEGCDYIKTTKELDLLFDIGIRAIAPVWNNENEYGSGIRGDKGLTDKGKAFVWHAFELGMAVDLSHANKKTFDDIIALAKLAQQDQKEELKPIVFASHSNVYSLCENDRNLTDEQLLKIKEVGGLVGLFSNRSFVLKDSLNKDILKDELVNAYIKHIKYLENLFGGIDNIALSTDDMSFCGNNDPDYYNCPIFNYSSIKNELETALKKEYDDKQVEKLIYKNGNRLIRKLLANKEREYDRYKTN